MVDNIRFDGLPAEWNTFNLDAFSRTKKLWNYQRQAVENAIKTLWKYYENVHNYQPDENAETNRERKRKFFQWYQDNGLSEELDIPLAKDRRLAHLLREYYTAADGKVA
jgi:type III restriction enzyme